MLAGATVIWRVGWGWRIPFQGASSHDWPVGAVVCGRPQFLSTWTVPLGCLSILMAWWLALIRVSNLRNQSRGCDTLTSPQKSLTVTSTIFYWGLIGSQGAILEAGYHTLLFYPLGIMAMIKICCCNDSCFFSLSELKVLWCLCLIICFLFL